METNNADTLAVYFQEITRTRLLTPAEEQGVAREVQRTRRAYCRTMLTTSRRTRSERLGRRKKIFVQREQETIMNQTVTEASHKNPPSDDRSTRTDEDLLLTYANQRDRRAFEELVRRYERELYTYLRNYLGDAGLAEDAFQGTFLQVHRKCRQYDTGRAVRPWLYAIATNQAIDLLRSNRRHKAISLNAAAYSDGSSDALRPLQDLLPGNEPDPDAQLDSAETREAIQAAIDKLPNRLKLPLILVMRQGMKYQDTAESLGIPVGTVKSRVHTAVARLQAALQCRLREAVALGT
jgi:RNA polymerase sigma-70 factor (ECF subfamily)